jgi:uncharacterized protein YjiS (DUF1127 family)
MPFLYVNDALAQVGFEASRGTVRRTLMRRWHRMVAQRRRVARYTRELEAYSNRELAELGLHRSDIPAVARGTYRRS